MQSLLHILAQIVVHRIITDLTNKTLAQPVDPLETKFCSNPIPGIQRLALGIDITQLDLKHDYSVDHIDGFKQKILDFTCSEGQFWISPFDGIRYDVPDQVNTVSALPSGLLIGDTLLHTNMNELRKSMAAEAGIDFNVTLGMFSASLTYKHSEMEYANSSRFVSSTKAFVSTTQVDLIPGLFLNVSLNKYVQLLVQQLPDKFDDNPILYEQFIQTYGTHYYASGYFGGIMMTSVDVEKRYWKSTSDEDVKANVEASFLGILKAHGAYDGNVSHVAEAFTEASHSTERYYGGVANLFDKEGYSKWWPTIAKNPWLYGGKLLPITDIIANGVKRASLGTAIEVYLRKAYLEEFKRNISYLLGKGLSGEFHIQALLNLVETYIEKPHPTESDVATLITTFVEMVKIPDWFAQAGYCVKWTDPYKPQERFIVNQCTTMLQITPDFDTCEGDHIEKDCHRLVEFTFGKPASTVPTWWSGMSIASNYAQQGGWASQFLFIVPADAPFWLLNLQFCFYVDHAPHCARANSWTPGFFYHNHLITSVRFLPSF